MTIEIWLNYFFIMALPWLYHYYYTKPSSLCEKLQDTNGMNILVFFINLTYSSPLVFSICFTLTGIVKKYITHQRKKGPKNASNSIGSPFFPYIVRISSNNCCVHIPSPLLDLQTAVVGNACDLHSRRNHLCDRDSGGSSGWSPALLI